MPKIRVLAKRYWFPICLITFCGILTAVNPQLGLRMFAASGSNAVNMLSVVPPIFIMIGLLDTWVKRETMVKYMGEGSGIVGILLAYLMGSASAGPLYTAFPVSDVLLRKGSTLSNVFIMVGAWSTTRLPMLLFEISNMGVKFTFIRLAMSIVGIFISAVAIERLLSPSEKEEIYKRAIENE